LKKTEVETAKISEELFSFLMKEQISTAYFANTQVANTVGLLNDAMKDITAKIIHRGQDGTFTTARLNSLLAEVRQMIDDSYREAEKQLHSKLGGFAVHQAESTTAVLSAQVPVAYSAVALNPAQIAAMTDGAPIGGKLLSEWWQSLSSSMATKTAQQIRLGVVEGESVIDIVRRLAGSAKDYEPGIWSIVRRETEAVVRTAVAGIANNAALATYAQNSDIVKGWVYVSTLDSRACPVCFSQSGRAFPLEEGPLPPRHVNCRCFAAPQIKTWKELGVDLAEMPVSQRASANGPVRGDITYGEWFKGQDKPTQVDILGPTRQKLYASGGLAVDAFTTNKGKLLTLDALKERNAAAFSLAFGG